MTKKEVENLFALNMVFGIIDRAKNLYDDFDGVIRGAEEDYDLTLEEAFKRLSSLVWINKL